MVATLLHGLCLPQMVDISLTIIAYNMADPANEPREPRYPHISVVPTSQGHQHTTQTPLYIICVVVRKPSSDFIATVFKPSIGYITSMFILRTSRLLLKQLFPNSGLFQCQTKTAIG